MTNTSIELSEVSTRFADVADRIRDGEEFPITLNGKVVALIVSAEDPDRRRALGMLKGRVWMSPDFDEPLSEAELKDWGY